MTTTDLADPILETKMMTLGDVATPTSRKAGAESDLPVYAVTKHRGFVPSAEYFSKQVFSRDTSGYKLVCRGEFAYATIHLDEGSIGIAPEDSLVSPMYTSFAVDESIVDPAYLFLYLKSPRAMAVYPQLGKGSAERRKSISFSRLKELTVPLPPLNEQRRRAAILDKADELRTKRRQALTHLDILTQSVFQAMVEDTGALLPAMTLADLGLKFSSGKNLISSDGDAHEHNRVIKVNAVSGGVFQPSESKPLPRTYIPNEQHRIRTGDLLFTRASGSLDLIGISARVREVGAHLFLPDKIWRAEFTPGAKVCPEYLQSLFKTPAFRAFVNNAASGAAGVKNISQKSVLGFVVSAPEPAAQEEFAKHVNAIELLKARHSAQLAELDALFRSLQHWAFRGEL